VNCSGGPLAAPAAVGAAAPASDASSKRALDGSVQRDSELFVNGRQRRGRGWRKGAQVLLVLTDVECRFERLAQLWYLDPVAMLEKCRGILPGGWPMDAMFILPCSKPGSGVFLVHAVASYVEGMRTARSRLPSVR
jgi:hypothetical protein